MLPPSVVVDASVVVEELVLVLHTRVIIVVQVVVTRSVLVPEVADEEADRLLAVHLEPVGADQVLLVEHGVVGAEEAEVLELKANKSELRRDVVDAYKSASAKLFQCFPKGDIPKFSLLPHSSRVINLAACAGNNRAIRHSRPRA